MSKVRGPGRPKSRGNVQIDKLGIIDAPSNPNHVFEFTYDKPSEIKNIFSYYKSMKVKDIFMICDKTEIFLFTYDHTKTQKTVVKIDCKRACAHYVNDRFSQRISITNIEKIISLIDSSIDTISFTQSFEFPNDFNIILRNNTLSTSRTYTIPVSTSTIDPELLNLNISKEVLSTYSIIFTLPDKALKKTISDFIALTTDGDERVSLEKDETTPPHFSYHGQALKAYEVYEKPEKINFIDNTGGTPFKIDIKVTNAKGLSVGMCSDNITIYAKEGTDMIFTSFDESQPIMVYTFLQVR